MLNTIMQVVGAFSYMLGIIVGFMTIGAGVGYGFNRWEVKTWIALSFLLLLSGYLLIKAS